MSHEKPVVYKAEFKGLAVKLTNESAKSIAQTARDMGVNENTLHTWISKYNKTLENAKSGRTDKHLYDELKRLKKEVAQLTVERDF
jgi:transposase